MSKYRYEVFKSETLESLREISDSVCRDFKAEIVKTNCKEDHLHLLIHYPAKVSFSGLLNSLEAVTIGLLKKNTRSRKRNIGKEGFGAGATSPVPAAVLQFRLYGSM